MEHRFLGTSGLMVSQLAFGNWITHAGQVAEDAATACVHAALDAGITTFDTADIYAGVWDDGSKKIGLSGITSENQMGIFVSNVGEKEDTNDVVTRLRFYCGLALYSELGIAMAPEVDDAVLP